MKIQIKTEKAPKVIGPYSQAIVNGDLIFTAGQIYTTSDGNLLDDTFEKQVHQVMKNLKEILNAAGVSFADVVKTTVYLTDMSLYGKMNEVYNSYMTEPFPAREAIAVKELPKGAKLEISMIAIINED